MAGTTLQGLVVALAIAGCVCAGASAIASPDGKIVAVDGHVLVRQSDWVRTSLMPAPPGRITLRFSGCPDFPRYLACVQMRRPRTIWMRRHVAYARAVLLHELGHVFDATVLDDRDRLAFKRIIGRRARWSGGRQDPAEWFADAYSLCARMRSIPGYVNPSPYGYAPSPARHAAACRLIKHAAAVAGG